MKLRQVSFKIISMVMVFAMLFSVSATTISAISWEHADHTHENGEDKIHYVSLGDSMSNGYGLPGYDMNSGVEDYGTGSYANQFAEWLGQQADVDHKQLAMSAMRAEDLHWLLEFDYNNPDQIAVVKAMPKDDGYTEESHGNSYLQIWWDEVQAEKWNAVFTTGDFWTWNEICTHGRTKSTAKAIYETGYRADCYDAADEFNVAYIAKYYQDAVKNGDILSLGMGNGNFGVFAFGRIMEAIGFDGGVPSDALIYNVENAIRELEPEMQSKVLALKAELDKAVADYIASDDNTMAAETVEALVNTIVYAGLSYVLNYAGSVEAMLQLNPDAEIILVALMNTFASNEEVEGITIGDLLGSVFTPLNAFIAALPTYMQLTENSVYADAKFYYAEADKVECLVDVYAEELANEASVVRARFVESIVGAADEPGMIWGLLSSMTLMPGVSIVPVTLEQIKAFEAAPHTVALDNANVAVSCAVYLAVEDAIVDCSKASVSVESILGLKLDPALFGSVMTGFGANISSASAANFESVVALFANLQNTSVDNVLFAYANDPGTKEKVDMLCMLYAVPETLSAALQADSDISGLLGLFARCVIGNGLGAHPSQNGHNALAAAVIDAYKNGYTAQDKTLGDLITLGNALVDYVKENYDEIYADVYAELVAAGYVDAAVAGVDEAIAAVNAAIAEVEGLDLHANLTDSKALLLEELALVADTLADVKNLLTVADQLDAETYAELEALVDTLGQHLDNALALAEELGDVADAQLQIALADLEALVEAAEADLKNLVSDLYDLVNVYLTETLPAEYAAFVEAVTDALRYYSAEAADYVYNWLLENPAKVIEFFAEYGDDAVDFLVDNAKAVFAVLGFVAKNYGEKLVGFVLDNAEVILTATAEWFSIHGEHVWELLVVYFDALVEYYNFDFELDFSSFEAIHESFNRVFVLLGDLVDLIAKGVYDFADALNILDEIEAELTNLNAKLSSAVRNQIDAVNGLVEDKIAALNAYFNAQIDALKAQAQKQIEIVKAEIEAQIAALKAQLETAVGEAKAKLEAEIARLEALLEAKVAEINAQVEAQIAALKAELEALVEMEIQHGKDAIAALDLLLQNGVKSLAAYICDTITNFVEDAVAGKFTPNEDTYYVSVNGGNADYADLLAEALSKNLDNPIALDKMTWGNLDYDKLALADLITIGFDENELSAFAVEQMLGYLEDYLNGDIRDSVVDHADGLIAAVVNNLLETYPVYGLILGEYEQNLAQDYADGLLNGAIDALVGNGELPEELGVSAETAAVLQWLGSAINGKDAQELDWAKYVGENNLQYVDEAREALRNELTKAGVIETYVLSISLVSADVHEAVVEFLAQIIEESGLVGTSRKNLEQTLEDLSNYDNFVALFGEYATYTIELPVVDSLVFAAESYLYNNVAFQVEYGKLILDLYEINPEATVVLLGHYNPFDFELALGDLAIDLTTAYGCVSGVASLQPFVYALLSEKVAYVDIYELETKYDSYVAEGVVENNLLNFVMMYLADNTITDASEAGNVYIYEQILNYLTIGCEHRYDNACDEICNKCGEHREVAGHVYDHACDTDCNVCGAIRVVGEHVYDYSCDTTCNICGATRRPGQHDFDENGVCVNCGTLRPSVHIHTFTGCDDTTCNTCDFTRPAGEHVFDNDCDDVTCYKCAYVRPYTPHTYTDCADSTCDVCGKERVSVPGHSYNNACDADCNVCGATRNVPAHVTSGCEDTNCNVCGAAVVAKGHTFGEWTVVTEATRKTNGQEVRTCSCGLREIKVIQALGGLGGGAIAGITVGSVVVAGAAGFAIFWFLIQKKSFAALIEGVKALVGGAAPAAAEAGAAAPAAEAEAPATEEETK